MKNIRTYRRELLSCLLLTVLLTITAFCYINAKEHKLINKFPKNDNETIIEAEEKLYRRGLSVILSNQKLAEGDDAVKPQGFRPILTTQDFIDLSKDFQIKGTVELPYIYVEMQDRTVVLLDEPIDYEFYFAQNKSAEEPKKSLVKVSLSYSNTQKKAFRKIFEHLMNTSMSLENYLSSYKQSDKFRLGELCLIDALNQSHDTSVLRECIFVRDCTTFIITDHNNAHIDVTPIAKYLDAKYAALTKEINSPPAFRKWFMLDGIFSVEGKYVSSDLVKVVLIDKDGKQSEIELTKLSPTDKLYTKRRYEINKATKLGKQTALPEAIAGTKLNVTESKIIFPNDLEYRKFESFDGQYYIEAKLVSFEIDKDNKKVVILEKKEDHKKIPIRLDKLSKDDQKYIQEKIDSQKKNKLD